MKTLNTLLMNRRKFLTTSGIVLLAVPVNANSQGFYLDNLIQSSKKKEFNSKDLIIADYKKQYPSIERLVEHFKTKGYDIDSLFSDEKFEVYDNIDKIFKSSPETKVKDYNIYKQKLGVEAKKKKIKKFVQDYNSQLSFAERKYGIEKELIASIIGIESDFGRNIGKYYPFNSFVSLFVKDYKKDFALQQLENLLKFSKDKDVDVFEMKSSYAGAIGFGQFIPSSLNQFFVGRDVYNMNNNIQSIANYLSIEKNRTKSTDKAIFAYNHSNFYVKAVKELVESAK